MSQSVDHKTHLQSLLSGALSEEEALLSLGALAAGSNLDQEMFDHTVDTVRRLIDPQARDLFVESGITLDCCGTGGSGLPHYNSSTTVAFLLAAAGVRVTKFGNRAASNRSGSFDFLDRLGIGAILPFEKMPELLDKTNLVFLFAPQFYPGLAPLAPLRRSLGKPTVFNYIGPLLNPALPAQRLLGVPDPKIQKMAANYLLAENRIDSVAVVSAGSGLDELDPESESNIIHLKRDGNKIRANTETVERQNSATIKTKSTAPLSVDDSVKIFNQLINGELDNNNYYHAIVCLNAGQALHTAGLSANRDNGSKMAADLLASGAVRAKFLQYKNHFAANN